MTREERIAELEKQLAALPTYNSGGLLGISSQDELEQGLEERSRLQEELNRERAVLCLEQKAERAEEILKASMRLVQSQEDRNAGVITLNELVGLIVKEACKTKPSFPADEYWNFYSAQSKEVKAVVMQALASHQLTPRKRGSLLPVVIGDSDWPTDAVVKRLEAWEWLSTIGALVPVGLMDNVTAQPQVAGESAAKFARSHMGHTEGKSESVEAERLIGWYDYTMAAPTWFGMRNITPNEAAMVLCRLNPLEDKDPERTFVDDDKTSPDRYRVLFRVFEDVASTMPKQRTLMDWKAVAQERGLRYHQWIDEYWEAQKVSNVGNNSLETRLGMQDAVPVQNVEPEESSAFNRSQFSLAKSLTLPGVTTAEIIKAFRLESVESWKDRLKKSRLRGRSKAFKPALLEPGRQGGESATWNPAKFAICLLETKERTLPTALRQTLSRCFPDYVPEFDALLEEKGGI